MLRLTSRDAVVLGGLALTAAAAIGLGAAVDYLSADQAAQLIFPEADHWDSSTLALDAAQLQALDAAGAKEGDQMQSALTSGTERALQARRAPHRLRFLARRFVQRHGHCRTRADFLGSKLAVEIVFGRQRGKYRLRLRGAALRLQGARLPVAPRRFLRLRRRHGVDCRQHLAPVQRA